MSTGDIYTETENEALAFKTTGNPLVDYFMLLVRDLKKNINNEHLEKCWNASPEKTVAIIFNCRDRVNGKKEKKVSNDAMRWLRKYKPNTYKKNIQCYVDKYGRWKDLLYISYYDLKGEDFSHELKMFSEQLFKDSETLKKLNSPDTVSDEKNNISLCAKWAPSEGDRCDQKKRMAQRLAGFMFGEGNKKKMEMYRKNIIAPLRKHIGIVENKTCANDWKTIVYKNVPAVASKKYANAFKKHDEEGYEKYLESVRSGEVKMKVTGILPHELAKCYIEGGEKQESIELQWSTILENVKSSGTLKSSLAIVDVSGSMFGAQNGSIPAQVAIALGVMTSCCSDGHFGGKIITFSEDPELMQIPTNSLYDAYKVIKDMEYGLSTDFVKCCKTIIDSAIENSISDSEMPKKIFVFTDMQFDSANPNEKDIRTTYEIISKMFSRHNYSVPKFIFWNLNSDHGETFPVNCAVENTAVVSGFSEQLLKIFMQYDEFNPEFIVDEIIKPYLEFVTISEDEK